MFTLPSLLVGANVVHIRTNYYYYCCDGGCGGGGGSGSSSSVS
jgi:hypothetical protein